MGDKLKGKVAIVTGGGRGLGRAEALALAAEGARVVVNDLGVAHDGSGPRERQPADEVVSEIKKRGGEAVANYDSVATPEGADNIIRTAIEKFGRLDILVNNAGIGGEDMSRDISDMPDDLWDVMIKTHLYGTFYTTRAACRIFRKQKSGRLIQTSSPSGRGLAGASHYSAAKEGIVGFTRTIAKEMSQYGVTCNAIRPAAATRLTPPRKIAGVKRVAPEDVAPMVAYLASDEAQNVSGRVFRVIGGLVQLERLENVQSLYSEARWTVDALAEIFPSTLGQGLEIPTPTSPPL